MKVFLIFSHSLTKSQIEELKSNGISEFLPLPKDLQKIWSNIGEDEPLAQVLKPIFNWLESLSNKGDYAVVSGNFGATFLMVQFCLKNNIIPLYSYTKRISTEVTKGSKVIKTSRFEHIKFKRYEVIR